MIALEVNQMTNAEQIEKWRGKVRADCLNEMLDMLEQQQAQIDVMALEFDRALDVSQQAAETSSVKDAVQLATEFIEQTSFEQSQQLLAQRDLATREDECYVIINRIKQDMYLSKDMHNLIVARVKQLKNGGEL